MLLIAILGLVVVATVREASDTQLSDCSKYTDDRRVASCASSLRKEGFISKAIFNEYLREAIRQGARSGTDYYSIGFTLGDQHRIVVGKQSDPSFDTAYSVPFNLRALYHDYMWAQLPYGTNKPMVIYSFDPIPKMPTWDPYFMFSQFQGSEDSHAFYTVKGVVPMTDHSSTNCAGFSQWLAENDIGSWRNVIVVLPGTLWCPSLSGGIVDVAIAKMVVHKTNVIKPTDHVDFEWIIYASGESAGRVPQTYQTVF